VEIGALVWGRSSVRLSSFSVPPVAPLRQVIHNAGDRQLRRMISPREEYVRQDKGRDR
jgi:hypothetical protein